jgi:hypothetical protein
MLHMESCGAQVAVAHSIDEALVTLEFWGILKRSRAFDISGSEILETTAGECIT